MKKAIVIGSLVVAGLLALFFSLPVTHENFVMRGTVLVKYLGEEEQDVVIPNGVTSIGERAFARCGLRTITLPSSVKVIGEMCFIQCAHLTTISMPGAVIIEESAFEECFSLNNITLPDSLTAIGDTAFFSCEALTDITIPANVSNIGKNVFYGCIELCEINVDSKNSAYYSIEGVLFDKAKATLIQYPIAKEKQSYSIPIGVKIIGDGAFENCRQLTSIVIPEGVTSIGYESFSGCKRLITIDIPESVKDITAGTFFGCDLADSVRDEIIIRFGERVFVFLPG